MTVLLLAVVRLSQQLPVAVVLVWRGRVVVVVKWVVLIVRVIVALAVVILRCAGVLVLYLSATASAEISTCDVYAPTVGTLRLCAGMRAGSTVFVLALSVIDVVPTSFGAMRQVAGLAAFVRPIVRVWLVVGLLPLRDGIDPGGSAPPILAWQKRVASCSGFLFELRYA